ncbi:PP2C family protein-serine/threonine phosphatase [Wenjunlia tyrosinilytica]|uniref:PP2C family protein-serine/threonine phosphatase n=1 Tax=Wenjunlia tyrosinilytica TaxID=1544741 RepID=UPI001E4CDAB8|nr:protein phosphatase 2C domain-containing protein [Wenjunlia tyrosinilytica]
MHHRPTGSGLLAVFDGAGGAGSGTAWHDGQNQIRTGAWVGSRVARLGVESWFAHHIVGGTAVDADSLEDHLRWLLSRMTTPARSKVMGKMRKQLPTTMAALHYGTVKGQTVCEALWAGDSRAYALTVDGGLRALTRDHTVDTNALTQLIQDPQMTNILCADQAFFVDSHQVPLAQPCVLLCATDGFFGYVQTPGDFEHVLLSTLHRAASLQDWSQRLATAVESYTGDDASLALAAIGYGGFEQMREQFAPRYRQLDDWARTMPDPGDLEAIRHWREAGWSCYRIDYEAWMPGLPVEEQDA